MLRAFIDDMKGPWSFKDRTGIRLCVNANAILRSLPEALNFLAKSPKQDEIYLDYVLSQDTTGMQVLQWLDEHPDKIPSEMNLISSDTEGNAVMARVCQKWKTEGKIRAYYIHRPGK